MPIQSAQPFQTSDLHLLYTYPVTVVDVNGIQGVQL
jgi:hypothetical protein